VIGRPASWQYWVDRPIMNAAYGAGMRTVLARQERMLPQAIG